MMVKDMDMSALFEKYSIEEIREIEKKTRYFVMSINVRWWASFVFHRSLE